MQLYILLCLNLIFRHINKHGDIEVDYIESLQDLEALYGEQFGYLTCKGSEDGKLMFCSHDLKKYNIEVSKMSGLGLLQIAPSTSVRGREKTCNFLHLTVQCGLFFFFLI